MQEDVRDPRGAARELALDLSRSVSKIDRDLRNEFPQHASTLWWELDEGDKSGWVYKADNHILAKLVHVGSTKPEVILRVAWSCLGHPDGQGHMTWRGMVLADLALDKIPDFTDAEMQRITRAAKLEAMKVLRDRKRT